MSTRACTVTNGNAVAEARGQHPAFTPRADILELESEFQVHVELPGVRREDLSIEIEKGVLHLHGEVVEERAKRRGWIAREYGVGAFDRRFRMGDGIDDEGIEADLSDGILTLRLPKRESARARKIEVREID